MVQDVYSYPIGVRFFQISAHNLDFEWKVDIRAIFKGNLHDALTWNLDYFHPRVPIFQFLETDYLRHFSLTLHGNYQRGQLINLQLKDTVYVSRHLKLGNTRSDENSHGFSIPYRQLQLRNLLSILHGLHCEYLVQIELFTHGEGVNLGSYLDHMELASLCLFEIVHKLGDERELLEGGGEDGILAEINLVFVDLEALARLEYRESAPHRHLLLWFIFHIKNIIQISTLLLLHMPVKG